MEKPDSAVVDRGGQVNSGEGGAAADLCGEEGIDEGIDAATGASRPHVLRKPLLLAVAEPCLHSGSRADFPGAATCK